MSMTVHSCTAHREAVVVVFLDAAGNPVPTADLEDVANYGVYAVRGPKLGIVELADVTYDPQGQTALLRPKSPITADQLVIRIKKPVVASEHVADVSLAPEESELGRAAKRATHAVEDAVSYALLTEPIDGGSSVGGSRGGGSAGGSLSQTVTRSLGDVLGWKVKTGDAKAFLGALTASFTSKQVEGRTEWAWTPRTYAVQTDLSGGIAGAQASLYKRAQEALTQSLPLLDGLYSLDPESDDEDVAAVKAVLRTQFSELVNELATPGGPSKTRVEQYFKLLLTHGGDFAQGNNLLTPEPDDLRGTLGELRDQLRLSRHDNRINSVEREQNQTNFRILADYVTSLAQSWLNNRDFFGLEVKSPFLGTQLVPLSRQLSVIAESVDEIRFALNSVFIGPAERETLRLRFGHAGEDMYAEDFFNWIQNFVTDEAPAYVQEGGKFGIGNSVLPFAAKFQAMLAELTQGRRNAGLPHGFHSARVRNALQSLGKELEQLESLASNLRHDFEKEPTGSTLQQLVDAPKLLVSPGTLRFTDPGDTQRITLTSLINAELRVHATFEGTSAPLLRFDNGQSGIELPVKEPLTIEVQQFGNAAEATQGHVIFTYRNPLDRQQRTRTVKVAVVCESAAAGPNKKVKPDKPALAGEQPPMKP